MKYTYQIRRYTSLAAAAVISACMLFGCTRSDVASTSQGASGAGASVGQNSVTGVSSGNALAGGGSDITQGTRAADQNQSDSAGQASDTASGAQQVAGQSAGQSANQSASQSAGQSANQSAAQPSAQSTDQKAGQPSAQGSGQKAGQPSAQGAGQKAGQPAAQITGQTAQSVSGTTTSAPAPQATDAAATQPQAGTAGTDISAQDASDYYNPDAAAAAEAFSGEYTRSDGEETVAIDLVNDNEIRFQFLSSGIGAYAPAAGNTAVYNGEDGYTITFEVDGDTLAVSVGGEGGASSPMNGIYFRILNEDGVSEEDAASDDMDGADDDFDDDDSDDAVYADAD